MQPTIYDVAKQAGVSIATVSKVVNNKGRIGEQTKKKVISIMKELNYQPNAFAAALTGKSTQTIGVIIPDLANPYFAELAKCLEDEAHKMGFSLMICSTDNNSEKEETYINLFIRKKVDGCILASTLSNPQLVTELAIQYMPVVLAGQAILEKDLPAVSVHDQQGGYIATTHLTALGHQRIAIIMEPKAFSSLERLKGYKKALKEAGLIYDENLVLKADATLTGGADAFRLFVDMEQPPTAIFACNDVLAIGVCQEAHRASIHIPDELSIIGFDNTILASVTSPPLTTVAQPLREMSRQMITTLLTSSNEKRGNQQFVFEPQLVNRQSTAKLN